MKTISGFIPSKIIDALGFNPETTKKYTMEEVRENLSSEVKQKRNKSKNMQEEMMRKVFVDGWMPTSKEAAIYFYGKDTRSTRNMVTNVRDAINRKLPEGVFIHWPRVGNIAKRKRLVVNGGLEDLKRVKDAILNNTPLPSKKDRIQINTLLPSKDLKEKLENAAKDLHMTTQQLVVYLVENFLREKDKYKVRLIKE